MTETQSQERGFGRRTLLRNLLITGVGVTAFGAVSIPFAGAAKAAGQFQDNWAWCQHCSEIFWAGSAFNVVFGVCPNPGSGSNHGHFRGNTNYTMMYGFPSDGDPADLSEAGDQAGWHWCTLCSALVWPGTPGPKSCPGADGGTHKLGSTNYQVPFGEVGGSQDGWCWCVECGCLFYSSSGWGTASPFCYVTDGYHLAGSPDHYQMLYTS